MKLYHVTPWKNVRLIRKAGLLPKRIRRGFLARRPDEPRVYLFVDRDTAEDAMTNWLVDEHPGTRHFGVVEVALPDDAPVIGDPEVAGAVYTAEAIPSRLITSVEKVDAGVE